MKILIAEDEPSLRENLQWMLELEGFTVVPACDGQEALRIASASLPDLILTDVMMPNMDGYGLIKALRAQSSTATVPIIMLTAKADRSDVRIAMNLGADDYLTKPYRREELLEAVHARLTRSFGLEKESQRVKQQAHNAQEHDPLTGLPSRTLFAHYLAVAVERATAQGAAVGLVCLGLDGFSKINESLGAAVGDQVLREVAARLTRHMHEALPADAAQAVARLGNDLFAVQWSASTLQMQDLTPLCARLQGLLRPPFLLDEHTLYLTACAGASILPQQAASAHDLLINAEAALHQAKPAGPGSAALFDSTLNQRVARHLQLHNGLHRAMETGTLQLYYQPQVRMDTGVLVGFEALLRWEHETLGWISPAEFIPVAEESGLIVKIGEWALHTAASQAAQWYRMGNTDFRMAVNLSVRQFAAENLPQVVHQALTETGLPPHMLELEVTESMALHSVSNTLSIMHACKALGVKLAMDDFGTGYSSLSYLKRYPLDALKIDQSFVRNITRDAGDAAITRAIVAMAHSFGMTVIAEGVETTDQLDFLNDLHCDDFQGYLFSKPVPADLAALCFEGFTRKPPREKIG